MLSDVECFFWGFLFGLAINLKRLSAFITKEPLFQLASATVRIQQVIVFKILKLQSSPRPFLWRNHRCFQRYFPDDWFNYQLYMTLPIRWLRRFIWSLSEVFIAHTFLYSRLVSLVWLEIMFFHHGGGRYTVFPQTSNTSPGSPLQKDAWKTKLLPLLHGSLSRKRDLGEFWGKADKLSSSGGISACEKVIDSVGTSNVSLISPDLVDQTWLPMDPTTMEHMEWWNICSNMFSLFKWNLDEPARRKSQKLLVDDCGFGDYCVMGWMRNSDSFLSQKGETKWHDPFKKVATNH